MGIASLMGKGNGISILLFSVTSRPNQFVFIAIFITLNKERCFLKFKFTCFHFKLLSYPVAIAEEPVQSRTTDSFDDVVEQSGEGDLRLGCAANVVMRGDLPPDAVNRWEQVEDSYTSIHDSWRFGSITGI